MAEPSPRLPIMMFVCNLATGPTVPQPLYNFNDDAIPAGCSWYAEMIGNKIAKPSQAVALKKGHAACFYPQNFEDFEKLPVKKPICELQHPTSPVMATVDLA